MTRTNQFPTEFKGFHLWFVLWLSLESTEKLSSEVITLILELASEFHCHFLLLIPGDFVVIRFYPQFLYWSEVVSSAWRLHPGTKKARKGNAGTSVEWRLNSENDSRLHGQPSFTRPRIRVQLLTSIQQTMSNRLRDLDNCCFLGFMSRSPKKPEGKLLTNPRTVYLPSSKKWVFSFLSISCSKTHF